MGRKKIEIRPLTDERNRNVTFLKRKAGLMKKAWELSVLCGADVSMVIFSHIGKAYEFSSRDLDTEIERYFDYEGMIERRRSAEFAAMALAGEDDEDDDDEPASRRGSTFKAGTNAAGPPKSLKGKETFKQKHPRSSALAGEVALKRRKNEGMGSEVGHLDREGNRSRSRKDGIRKKSFVESIISGTPSDDSEFENPVVDKAGKSRLKIEPEVRDQAPEGQNHSSFSNKTMDGLHYALNLHAMAPDYRPLTSAQGSSVTESPTGPLTSQASIPQAPRLPSVAKSYHMPAGIPSSAAQGLGQGQGQGQGQTPVEIPQSGAITSYPYQGNQFYQSSIFGLPLQPTTQSRPNSYPPSHNISQIPYFGHSSLPLSFTQFPQTMPGMPMPSSIPTPTSSFLPSAPAQEATSTQAGVQWDPSLLARYAEFQLQQNHQKQQRALLERQRQQLMEMGVPLDDKSLLDEIFGETGGKGGDENLEGIGNGAGTEPGSGYGKSEETGLFMWPTTKRAEDGASSNPSNSSSHHNLNHTSETWNLSDVDTFDNDMSTPGNHGHDNGVMPSPVSAGASGSAGGRTASDMGGMEEDSRRGKRTRVG